MLLFIRIVKIIKVTRNVCITYDSQIHMELYFQQMTTRSLFFFDSREITEYH